jgi:hypothetical protein
MSGWNSSAYLVRVGLGEIQVGSHFALEDQFDAELLGPRLQDVEQPLAADADKAVAGGAHPAPLDQDFDVIPMVEGLLDRIRRDRIPFAHVVHGRIGEHHAKAERVVGPVALDHGNLVRGIQHLHQDAEIKPGRPASDADDTHGDLPLAAAGG